MGFSTVVHQAKDTVAIAGQGLTDLSQKVYHPRMRIASQAGREPVATDGSEPVGSVSTTHRRQISVYGVLVFYPIDSQPASQADAATHN